jgi:hypothetical protein
MVCLFHGDYGPPDPAFTVFAAAGAAVHGWTVDPHLLKDAHNIGEAEAIQRHVLKGEPVSWCHQGYAWVDQDAIGWFYLAAFVFVVLTHQVWLRNPRLEHQATQYISSRMSLSTDRARAR